ncbi:MAG: hypothetical protein SGILL_004848, partial [Bacillariaceae sp.]
MHPVFWCALLFSAIFSVLEMSLIDPACMRLGEWGHIQQEQLRVENNNNPQLSIPLLANDGLQQSASNEEDEERQGRHQDSLTSDDENAPGTSDIGGDTDYKASWSDLLHLCAPDSALIMVAFVFLLAAAAAQIYIPRFTGAILDALDEAYNKNNDHSDVPIEDVPGFMSNVRKLIVVSILGGVFSGIRGSIFTVYLALTYKSAIAYSGYATVATSLPQLVTALVVFYGGLLVRNGDISSGEL